MKDNLKLVCPKCGTPHQPHSPHTLDADGFERCEIRTIMEDKGWCYECSFWQNMYDKHKDDPDVYKRQVYACLKIMRIKQGRC